MKVKIYIDFETHKVYSEKVLHEEAERIATKYYDNTDGFDFEDFLSCTKGYTLCDVFHLDTEAREEILKEFHESNINIVTDGLMQDVEEFEIEV